MDIRYIEDHGLETTKPVYVIAVLENYSRALLASLLSPRQDLTAYLVVLRDALQRFGAPELLVSDSGGRGRRGHRHDWLRRASAAPPPEQSEYARDRGKEQERHNRWLVVNGHESPHPRKLRPDVQDYRRCFPSVTRCDIQ